MVLLGKCWITTDPDQVGNGWVGKWDIDMGLSILARSKFTPHKHEIFIKERSYTILNKRDFCHPHIWDGSEATIGRLEIIGHDDKGSSMPDHVASADPAFIASDVEDAVSELLYVAYELLHKF